MSRRKFLEEYLEEQNRKIIKSNKLLVRMQRLKLPWHWKMNQIRIMVANRDKAFKELREIVRKENPEVFIKHG